MNSIFDIKFNKVKLNVAYDCVVTRSFLKGLSEQILMRL